MNVLYDLNSFPKLSESFILNEIVELANRGHNIAVFALRKQNESVHHERFHGLDITVRHSTERYNTLLDHLRYFTNARIGKPFFSPGWTRAVGSELNEFITSLDFDVDVIHGHFPVNERLPAIQAASDLNLPISVSVHAYGLFSYPNNLFAERICSEVDRIIAISEYNAHHIESEFNIQTPIDVIPTSIRPSKFEPRKHSVPKRILSVGRFVEKKGFSDAIESINRLADQHPSLSYHIVGSGPLGDELREQVTDAGLEDTVTFLGNVNDGEFLDEMARAEVFLLPCVVARNGDRDGIPMAIKEAMAMETACISTPISGIPELLTHRQNGLLSPPGDPDRLARSIEELFSDDDLRQRLARAGRKRILEDHTVEKNIPRLESVFEELVRVRTV